MARVIALVLLFKQKRTWFLNALQSKIHLHQLLGRFCQQDMNLISSTEVGNKEIWCLLIYNEKPRKLVLFNKSFTPHYRLLFEIKIRQKFLF